MTPPKPKLTVAFKKKVKRGWHEQIPSLLPDPIGFFISRLVGPLTIGISFDTKSYNNHYYPVFDCQTLFDIRTHLGRTLSERLMKSRISFAGEEITSVVSISVARHEKGEYIEAIYLMKEQALLPLEGPISVSMIWDAYREYSKRAGTSFQMSLIQDPALIAAWAGREDIAKQALEWGYQTYQEWMANRRDQSINDNPDEWLRHMEEKISHREVLKQNVLEMIKKHGLEYLPQEELIPE